MNNLKTAYTPPVSFCVACPLLQGCEKAYLALVALVTVINEPCSNRRMT